MIAEKDGGVSAIFSHPAMPIAPAMENMIIRKVVSVPEKPLTQKNSTSTKTSIMIGNSVSISYWLASGKA